MTLFRGLKSKFFGAKKVLEECNDLENLLKLINYVPNLAGFSFFRQKETVAFWVLHFSLLFYVYLIGCIIYQWFYAADILDYVKSNVNVALLIFIANNSWWYIKKRLLVQEVLTMIKEVDKVTKRNVYHQYKHKRILTKIMRILFVFYAFNYINLYFVYLPNRMQIESDYGMTTCVGIHRFNYLPLNVLCYVILGVQEITISSVVLNFQSMLLLLVAHTAGMYRLMADEINLFNEYDNINEHKLYVKNTLPGLIDRHVSILKITQLLTSLYSMPIGVNFGGNAVCLTLFFYLPLQEWLQFMPVLVYCGLVFSLYCFLCQQLVDAAEKFERAVYSCGWENFDLSEKKLVYVMLLQAQKPVRILAADIIAVNLPTFATTLQAMYKFITVVKL